MAPAAWAAHRRGRCRRHSRRRRWRGRGRPLRPARRLPGPPACRDQSAPPANLHVLDWAGFQSALTYTFDDAQPSQIEHYAELQATGVHLTFFIDQRQQPETSAPSTRPSRRRSTDGHEMGNHTVHHCHANLTGCSTGWATSLDAELDDCNRYITHALWSGAGLDSGEPIRRHRLRRSSTSRASS